MKGSGECWGTERKSVLPPSNKCAIVERKRDRLRQVREIPKPRVGRSSRPWGTITEKTNNQITDIKPPALSPHWGKYSGNPKSCSLNSIWRLCVYYHLHDSDLEFS